MSFFPAPGQNNPSGPSAFGSHATNATPQSNSQASNLFSNPWASSSSQPQPASGFSSNPWASSVSPFANLASNQQQQQQQPTTSSPFGGLGGTTLQPPSAPTTGGFFGRQNANQVQQNTPQTGGPFGNVGGNQTQPQQQQLTTGGALGNLGGLPFQQQQQQQQPANTAGAFGASILTNAQAQTQQPNLQAGQLGGAASQPAYFDHLLERGKKRRNDVSRHVHFDLPSLELGFGDISRKVRNLGTGGFPTQEARTGDTKAHYLLAASGVPTGSAIRDLDSLIVHPPTSHATPSPSEVDTDVEGYVKSLQKQSTLDLIAESLEQSKKDFDAFLEENVQIEWEAQRRRIYEHFGLYKPAEKLGEAANGDANPVAQAAFGRSARKSKGFGASVRGKNMIFGASAFAKSVIGPPGGKQSTRPGVVTQAGDAPSGGQQPGPDDRAVRDKEERYADKVKELNESRIQEMVYPLAQQFASVEEQAGGDNNSQLIEAYKALIEITGERSDVQSPSDPGAIKERQYAPAYLDDTLTSGRSIDMRKRILNGSQRFLEKKYYDQLEVVVAKNPKEANLGGVPSTLNKVRAYIRLRASRKDLGADISELQTLGNDYCWVLIFNLLRCGLVKEAAQYVQENERAIKSMDRNFPIYMSSYAKDSDRRLPRDLQTKINAEYLQRSRLAPEDSLDPYRMACYKIIGRCELSRRNLERLNQDLDDWMWLQLALAREVNRVEENAGEVLTLDDVRSIIHDIGQRHFTEGSEGNGGFTTYFFLQILAGMFEQAIAYLYPRNYVAALHFAIALDFYGLLRVSEFTDSDSNLLTYNARQKPQISFARMVGYYTGDFRAARPEAAADYLILICLNSDLEDPLGKSQTSICHEALRELVLETREFAQLLGDIRTDGQRIRGAIEQRLKLINLADQEDFLRAVTVRAAAVADDSGRTTDAVLLYHLAEQYDDVIVIINRALSEAITVDIGQEPMRLQPLKPRIPQNQQQQQAVQQGQGGEQQQKQPEGSLSLTSVEDPVALAQNMIGLYNANAMYYQKIRQQNRDICGALILLCKIKSLVEAGLWMEALDGLSRLDVLPIRANSNIALIRASAQKFNSIAPVLARTIGPLLMWTIKCCGRQREILHNSAFEDRTKQEMGAELLTIAKDLMVFAGLVRYKLPARVFEALAKAGSDVVDT